MMMLDRNAGDPAAFEDALVDLVASLRGDWDKPGIRAAIIRASQRDQVVTHGQFAAACVNAALNREFRTPQPIAFNGEHWAPTKTVGVTSDPGPICDVCNRPEPRCRAADARVSPSDQHDFIERH